MKQPETYSIRQMVELTGLSEFTLRGWENRYSAFEPQRSATGRREYLKKDVEKALLLRELTKRGFKIGNLAALKNRKLQALFEEVEKENLSNSQFTPSPLVAECLELLSLQKWSELEQLVKSLHFKSGIQLIHDFFLPLLQEHSKNVSAGWISISQEHILSALLKEKIYADLSKLNSKSLREKGKRSRFVLATPEGDHHEIGLLLAHLMIRTYGFESLYLGPHTPAQDLSETALRFEASHVVLVSTVSKNSGAKMEPFSYLNEIQKKFGTHIHIYLAGHQAPLGDSPQNSLTVLQNFYDLETSLKKLD